MRFHALRASDAEIYAALHLSQVAHVRVEIAPAAPSRQRLIQAGFFQLPSSIDSTVLLPFEPEDRPRTWRKNLARSMAAWEQAELRLSLATVASYGLEKLVSQLYFPIFVPQFYARGMSPYGAHNLDTFRGLAAPDTYVAVVERGDQVVGGALLRRAQEPASALLLKGLRAEGSSIEGLVYVLREEIAECRRALLLHLCEAFTQLGFPALSLGRDTACIDPGYAPVLLEKLRWADSVSVHVGPEHELAFIHEGSAVRGRGMVVLTIDGEQRVGIRSYGEAARSVEHQLRDLLPGLQP